ncbi:hypothetical protein ABXS75_17210 [Roseburia hominis]
MRRNTNELKSIEAESKRFLGIEKESAIEEFRQCVFEEIFRKKLGYNRSSTIWDKEQQVYIIDENLKIKITFDEVDERSIVNRLFRDYTNKGVKDSTVEWGMVISPKGIWLFNNSIGKGISDFQTKKTVLEIVYGKNSDQHYFDFLSYDNICGIEPNTYFFKDIAEYRNSYYKGGEKSWPAYSSSLKRFLKYCSIDLELCYFKNEVESVYDKIEITDFYRYIEKKTKLEKENTLKNVFFYIKDFMCLMSEKSAFDISTKVMLEGFSKTLKRDEKRNVINLDKIKKAIQYLDTGRNKERDVAMLLMELSFGLERRKLRFLKWKENVDYSKDGSIKDKLKLDGKEIHMPAELIGALKKLKALNVRGDYIFYRTKDNGGEPIREDVINDVFSKLTKIDPNDEYYKSLTPASIRGALVRYLLAQGVSLEKIIYLMNIEIWNLGNYISLKEIDWIMEERNDKEDHPMEDFLKGLKSDLS